MMREDDLLTLAVVMVLLVLSAIVVIAMTAGNIVNQLLAPVPSVGGPLGAAAALFVFVLLAGKGMALVIGQL
ncbi:hypothetical protein ACFQH6_01890 [Halobacteriaceae archaeon GCM10025711]